MTNSQSDLTLTPILKALGGWVDAPWFSPSLMSDSEVVGFQFPALPGVRKQNFEISDRLNFVTSKSSKKPAAPAKLPKQIGGRISIMLDGVGATRAVACGRSRFLFEPSPTLFFAEIPSAKVKLRSANRLRKDLIDIGVLACVVGVGGATVTVMFWPATENSITDFVEAAAPEHPLHLDFLTPSTSENPPNPKRTRHVGDRSDPRAIDREKRLLKEVASLRQQVDKLQQSQSVLGAMEKLGLDDARLRSMLVLLHPDKHGGSSAASDAATWINNLRDLLKTR